MLRSIILNFVRLQNIISQGMKRNLRINILNSPYKAKTGSKEKSTHNSQKSVSSEAHDHKSSSKNNIFSQRAKLIYNSARQAMGKQIRISHDPQKSRASASNRYHSLDDDQQKYVRKLRLSEVSRYSNCFTQLKRKRKKSSASVGVHCNQSYNNAQPLDENKKPEVNKYKNYYLKIYEDFQNKKHEESQQNMNQLLDEAQAQDTYGKWYNQLLIKSEKQINKGCRQFRRNDRKPLLQSKRKKRKLVPEQDYQKQYETLARMLPDQAIQTDPEIYINLYTQHKFCKKDPFSMRLSLKQANKKQPKNYTKQILENQDKIISDMNRISEKYQKGLVCKLNKTVMALSTGRFRR